MLMRNRRTYLSVEGKWFRGAFMPILANGPTFLSPCVRLPTSRHDILASDSRIRQLSESKGIASLLSTRCETQSKYSLVVWVTFQLSTRLESQCPTCLTNASLGPALRSFHMACTLSVSAVGPCHRNSQSSRKYQENDCLHLQEHPSHQEGRLCPLR